MKKPLKFNNFAEIVHKVMARRGINHEANAAFVCELTNQLLISKFSSIQNISAQSYKDQVLTIMATNSIWAQELFMLKTSIKIELNDQIKPLKINKIRIVTGKIENCLTSTT